MSVSQLFYDDEKELPGQSQFQRTKISLHRFYRGTLFQAIILGLVSFTQPGIWDAMNNLGAGGQAQPFFVNTANVITFVIMVIGAPISGIIGNIIGMKKVLIFGTLGYVPYSAALYCNSRYGTEWFLLFGAATCGLSAAALWTAEAAIAVGYPEPKRRGLYIGIWMALNKLGTIIGSSIQLGLNVNNANQGHISNNTYLVLVGLQCLGLPLALLISPPDKLIRSDGKTPTFTRTAPAIKSEVVSFWRILISRRILLLLPIFTTLQWGQTYEGNYLAAYFSVRARGLAGFVIAIISLVVSLLTGWFLDATVLRRSIRAKLGWAGICVLFVAVWVWTLVLQVRYSTEKPVFDIVSKGFGNGVAVYIVYRICYTAGGIWMYWVLGTYDVEVDKLGLTTGILRSCESLGSSFSYLVGSMKAASLLLNLIVAVVVFVASIPTTTWAAFLVADSLGIERESSVDVTETVGEQREETVGKE